MKEYIIENFKKDFIKLSKILYSTLILFALKANEDLQFCIDYQGFNAIIKHCQSARSWKKHWRFNAAL